MKGNFKMNNLQLAKMITKALENTAIEVHKNIYILKPDTIRKISVLEKLLHENRPSVNFDRTTNSIDINLTGYVFDSCVCELKQVFQTVDLFVIDAMNDGKVCIEMKIINAAEIMRRD